MKKLLGLALATFMLAGVAGCSGGAAPESENNETTAQSAENVGGETTETFDGDKIIIGLDDEFPPMGFRDEQNELVGFDIDLAKAAGEKMGVEVEFQPIDWDTKELELDSGSIDLIWNGFTMTDERVESMEFTKPYLKNTQIILVPQDSAIQSKADLSGKIVGLQDGSSALDAVEADEMVSSLGDVVKYDTNVLAFQDLAIGRVDAVVADEIVVKYYLANNENNFRIIEDGNFGDELYGIAAKKGNTALIGTLQGALDELSADGTAAEISTKWFGDDIYEHPESES